MLLVGMTSSILIATQAMSPPGPQADVLDAAELTFIIEDELESSVHILSHSSSQIEFVTPDRDQDSDPEFVEYAWNFDDSRNLVRTANGEPGAVLLPDVHSFSLLPRVRHSKEDLGGSVSESSVSSLIGLTSASSYDSAELDSLQFVGQSYLLTHAANTICWSIDGVWLVMKRRNSSYASDDAAVVQIRRSTGDGLPTSEVLAQAEIAASDLRNSYRWKYFEFADADRIPADQNTCVVVQPTTPNSVIEVLYADTGVSSDQALIGQSLYGSTWQLYPGRGLLNSIRGTRHSMDDSSHEVIRDYISACTIDMQMTDDSATRVRRGIRLLNSPEDIDQFWLNDFSVESLSTTDANFDGINDWTTTDGQELTSMVAASVLELSAGQKVQTNPAHRFDGLITIDTRLKAMSANPDGGAVMLIPVGGPTSGRGLLKLQVSLNDNGLQTASVIDTADADERTLAAANGLPNEFVDVRVVIDTTADQVGVWINGLTQGRSEFSRSSTSTGQVTMAAQDADAQFDYVSVRIGRSQ